MALWTDSESFTSGKHLHGSGSKPMDLLNAEKLKKIIMIINKITLKIFFKEAGHEILACSTLNMLLSRGLDSES